MSAKEFDELLKSTLSHDGFEYDPEDYVLMTKQLAIARKAKPSRKILLVLLSMAACLAFAVIIAGLTYRTEKPAFNTIAQTNAKVAPVPQHSPTPNNHIIVVDTTKTNTLPANKKTPRPLNLYAANSNAGVIKETKDNNKATTGIFSQSRAADAMMSKSTTKENTNSIAFAQKSLAAPYKSFKDESLPLKKETEKEYNRKLNISLAGGLNYGSLNQGYALGASARKNLNSKLYLEGDIAYINTNATGNAISAKSYSPPPVTNPNTVNATGPASRNNSVSSFNYLQMSPVVGYHIHKKLTLGLGPDIQRLLQNNPSTATVASAEADKTAPDLDLGFVGKTEYAVSGRLNAGFIYREGMNNFLSGTNKYFERNYFQFQLKYSLFNR